MKFTRKQLEFIAKRLKASKPENHQALRMRTPLQEWEYTLLEVANGLLVETRGAVDIEKFLIDSGYREERDHV